MKSLIELEHAANQASDVADIAAKAYAAANSAVDSSYAAILAAARAHAASSAYLSSTKAVSLAANSASAAAWAAVYTSPLSV